MCTCEILDGVRFSGCIGEYVCVLCLCVPFVWLLFGCFTVSLNMFGSMNDSTDNLAAFENIDPDDNLINQLFPGNGYGDSLYYSFNNLSDVIDDTKITFVNFNVRSFKENLESFRASLVAASINPDVLVLTESWLNDPVEIEGYNSFHLIEEEWWCIRICV